MKTHEIAQENRKRSIQAFTLAELLIVVAIISVLVAVSVPMFTNKLKNTEKTVCETNRKMLVRQIQVERMEKNDFSESDAEDLMEKSDAYCPAGGKYTVTLDELYIRINCDLHGTSMGGAEDADAKVTGTFIKDYKDFTVDYLKKNPNKTNDSIRQAFLEKYNGKWPTLVVDGKSYSIQPFYQGKDKTKPVEECVWLFARENTGAGAGWNVPYVYNVMDGKWYGATNYNGSLGGSASITYDDTAALNKAILTDTHSNGKSKWVEVTDFKEIK